MSILLVSFSQPREKVGWQYPCEKSDYVYVKLNGVRVSDVRLKIPSAHACRLLIFQTDEQKSVTPPDIFCYSNDTKWIEVSSFAFNAVTYPSEVSKDNLLPIGVKHLHFSTASRQYCGAINASQYSGYLPADTLSTGVPSGMSESCRLSTFVPGIQLSIAYDITTAPYERLGVMTTEKNWPYAYYPRDTWSDLEKQMQVYLQSLIY